MHHDDLAIARRALAGDESAAADIRSRQPMLVRVLAAKAPSRVVAEDIAADVISDCFGGRERTRGAQSRILEEYRGQCSLDSWLLHVAGNRLKDWVGSARFRYEIGDEETALDGRAQSARHLAPAPSVDVETLVAEAFEQAFARAQPLHVVFLRLVYIHNVSQREAARIWGWHESKVSRLLKEALSRLRNETLAYLAAQDANLELRWEDCLAVSGTLAEALRES